MSTQRESLQGESRRTFIRKTTAAAIGSAAMLQTPAYVLGQGSEITILVDPEDRVANSAPVRWAIGELRNSLEARGVSSRVVSAEDPAGSTNADIVVAGESSKRAGKILESAGVSISHGPESLALVMGKWEGREELLVFGLEERGLIYGLLELCDRVTHAGDALLALRSVGRIVQKPANPIRSMTRLFTSEAEDKPWFYDKNFWEHYLTMLAHERFNRFSLAFGLGYNRPRNVPDSYLYFAYPFLLSVPGYSVKAEGLPDQERDRNLEMLRWISEQTKARGLHFQLAIWTHAYDFIDSPNVNYRISGLNPENHGPYCRDAVKKLLQLVPTIDGLTIRAHSESGIPEGSYDFWNEVLEGIAGCGRKVEVDFHSKGIEHKLLDLAMAKGLTVNVSPKYWAEHMGLPYHQASIRELERSVPTGADVPIERRRRFTRYGYADYLREDRGYGVLYRMWPGTQRLLLWADPALAAGYGRSAHFCGSLGLELMEPLSFKGRMGSGSAGGREQYADASLRPKRGAWEKYLCYYRAWGRLLYDPNESPEVWGRYFRTEFGEGAEDCEEALANASRILPLITTAHDPSASNNRYWPEIYTDMPIVDERRAHPYGDTPDPKRFGTVSSLDPVLIANIEEFADELAKDQASGKYSPLEVAIWLEKFATAAEDHLRRAEGKADGGSGDGDGGRAAFRRLAIDVKAQVGLGRFFAAKLRAAVAYELYRKSGDRRLLGEAVSYHRSARDAWKKVVNVTQAVYVKDLTFGQEPWLRGHWVDRLAAIEADLADMEKIFKEESLPAGAASQKFLAAFKTALPLDRVADPVQCRHLPPPSFKRGESLAIELAAGSGYRPAEVRLHYRHANQAEVYEVVQMKGDGRHFRYAIPGRYTDSSYPLIYFFELRGAEGKVRLHPGFEANLSNQPYFVVRATQEF